MTASDAFCKAIIAATYALTSLVLKPQRNVDVVGLPAFLSLLDRRRSANDLRGLITVSNHKSVIDDPLLWTVLPLSYISSPAHLRHALGSADICFTNPFSSRLFTAGNVHATYRLHKSELGGLYQPVISKMIELLEQGKWVHVFPEGRVHQHPNHQMRYFKWGVSRFILEPEVVPRVVPIFITGFEEVMHEDRWFPRFIPRVGKDLKIVFGEEVPERRWEDVRRRWKKLKEQNIGENEDGEAVALRIETTLRVREEVNALRRKCGFPEESEDAAKPETYKELGMSQKEGKLKDGTYVKDT